MIDAEQKIAKSSG